MKKHLLRCIAGSFFSLNILISAVAQSSSVPPTTAIGDNPTEFVRKLGEFVILNKQPESIEAFTAFEKKWRSGAFSERETAKIMATIDKMKTERLNAVPYFVDYLEAATAAESGGDGKGDLTRFEKWHDIVDAMLADFHDTRKFEPVQRFLRFSSDFLSKNAIFLQNNSVNWYVDNRDYQWKMEKGTPSVIWEKVQLAAAYKKDSIQIVGSKGAFYPVQNQFRGSGARVSWERFKNLDIFCQLSDFTIDVSKGFYHAEKAKLHYPALFPESDVEGAFDDKVNFAKAQNEDSYPRFETYAKRLKINGIGKNIGFEGGFRLWGMTVYGYGTKEEKAQLTMASPKTGKRAFRAASTLFSIRKGESVFSENSEASILFGTDSIYHPSVILRINIDSGLLVLTRGERASQRNPFYNSYHQVNMEMTKIKWFINKDSLILGDKNPGYGINDNNAMFESFKFFSEPDFRRVQNIATRNPIVVLKMYADQKFGELKFGQQRTGKTIINADEAMRQINPKMDAGMVQSLISDMVASGFLNYDPEKNELELKDKVFHYSLANQKKVDYEVLRFKSETKSENAFLSLVDTVVTINGIKGIELSTRQKVRVIPKSETVRLKHNRDFDFDGRLFSGFAMFHGKKYHFDYDLFQIRMDSARYLDLYLKTGEDAYKKPIATAINSRLEHLQGVLLIDAPNNKSGREDITMFPSFQSKTESYVFYDAPEIQDSCYRRDSFYFKLDKFNLDNLDSLTRPQLNFKGTMVSSDIFPQFREALVLQPDSSLGFVNRTNTEGYSMYLGKGLFKGDISLSNKGFLGKGSVTYLDATIDSKNVIFKPKQMIAASDKFEMAENRGSNVPKITAPSVNINWLPRRDSMYLTVSGDTSFKFFADGDYKMRRTIIVTPSGVKGIGEFEWEKGLLKSKQFSFGSHSVAADTMALSIKALDKAFSEQLALDTKNIQGKIDFDEKKGRFKSNSDKDKTTMPAIKYQTTINEFDWLLDSEVIDFQSKGDDALFLSIDQEQDSLKFYGKKASYDLKLNILKVGGVEAVKTCDAFVYPNEQKVQVELGGKMTKLENAKIVCDTMTKNHVINRATVNIKGLKDYQAEGFYEYNVAGKAQEIKFDNIIGQRVGPGNRSHKRTETSATGTVKSEDNFLIDAKTMFKGTISLVSSTKNLKFDGFAQLQHENLPIREWFSVSTSADKTDLALRYNVPKNEAGEPLFTGIFISKENTQAYPRVMMPLSFRKDRAVIDAKGVFKYDAKLDKLTFGDTTRVLYGAVRGNKMVYDNRNGSVFADGKLGIGSGLTAVHCVAAGTARTNFRSPLEEPTDSNGVKGSPLSIEAMIGLDMLVPEKLLKIMAADIQAGSFDAPEADYKKDDFTERALGEFVSDDKDLNKIVQTMKEKTLDLPDKYNKFSFLFSRVPMRWNPELQSFVNASGKADINSVLGININKKVSAFIELKMPANDDDRVYVYIKTANDFFYFFGYQKGILEITSTNPRMEEEFNKIKPKDRNRKAPDGTSVEMQWGEAGRAEMFVRRVQSGGK